MRKFVTCGILALGVFAALLSEAGVGRAQQGGAKSPFDTIVPLLKQGDAMAATLFVDQDGRRVRFVDLKGNTVAVAFVYTRCKDACPVITQKFGQLRQIIGAGPFRLVEVTVDPAYDTRPVVADYTRRHGIQSPQWLYLTGRTSAVADFELRLGVQALDSGGGEILHNDRVVLLAPDGTIADFIDGSSWTAADMAAQMRHIAGQSGSWLERFDLALGRAAAFCGSAISGRSGLGDLIASVGIFAVGIGVFAWLIRRLSAG